MHSHAHSFAHIHFQANSSFLKLSNSATPLTSSKTKFVSSFYLTTRLYGCSANFCILPLYIRFPLHKSFMLISEYILLFLIKETLLIVSNLI
jgi:hypothetical protein